MSEFGTSDEGVQEGDAVDRVEDASGTEGDAAWSHQREELPDQVRSSDLVADVTLAQSVTYTPEGLRVLRTSYVFKVNQAVRGAPDEYVTVHDTGGVYPDGSTVSTERSFKLSPGGRYIVFATRSGEDLWLRQVLQVQGDGAVVADASGRALLGTRDGVPVAQPEQTYAPLRYIQPVAGPTESMESPPSGTSMTLPAPPAGADGDAARPAAMDLEGVLSHLRSAVSPGAQSGDVSSEPAREGDHPNNPPPDPQPRANIEGRSQESAPGTAEGDSARAVVSGNYVTAFQSHVHFMPDDNQWAWTGHCRSTWNALVNNQLGLFPFKVTPSTGQPIRDRLPAANNGQNNVGVLSNAQMTSGGYDTWDVLQANGVCYTWTSNNRVRETDILINPSIAGNEAQFRKTLTHEYGHALTLGHQTEWMGLMYPGTFRQPPNYASLWYSRRDDHRGVQTMLRSVNSNVAAGTWDIAQFTDMATWSQAHDAPGTAGNLVMTQLSSETVDPGDTVTVRFVHLENRGEVPAQNVRLTFYLSVNDTVSANDREIGTYTWNTFTTWWSGSLNVRIPQPMLGGQYYLGWIVTTDTAERSSSNNTAMLLRDHNSGFGKVRITVRSTIVNPSDVAGAGPATSESGRTDR